VADVARFLRLSQSTVYDLMARGLLPYVKIGKSRRIPHRAVVELAAQNLVTRDPS
jgi:excisionase family DNA binding protein